MDWQKYLKKRMQQEQEPPKKWAGAIISPGYTTKNKHWAGAGIQGGYSMKGGLPKGKRVNPVILSPSIGGHGNYLYPTTNKIETSPGRGIRYLPGGVKSSSRGPVGKTSGKYDPYGKVQHFKKRKKRYAD